MTTEALKSTSITNDDATPVVFNTAGQGAAGLLRQVNDFTTTTSGKTVGSTYRLVRVPTKAKVKAVTIDASAMTQGSFDIGIYRTAADGGAVVSAGFFGTAIDCSSAVRATDVTNESGTYTADKQNKELWDAAAVSADPGGFYDIVATSTNTITAGALLALRVTYVG